MEHPNLVPVVCLSPNDLKPLAEEMRTVCRNQPTQTMPEYSKTVQEAVENARQEIIREIIIESGHTRFVLIPGLEELPLPA